MSASRLNDLLPTVDTQRCLPAHSLGLSQMGRYRRNQCISCGAKEAIAGLRTCLRPCLAEAITYTVCPKEVHRSRCTNIGLCLSIAGTQHRRRAGREPGLLQ
ncbi:hypothetical protein RB195_019251 [Necator americanus]|uniref:Uncharacterized protein n=1 Tax=Necator americanus TaxID=51031 RepID=A0ABR1CDC3_NECAM